MFAITLCYLRLILEKMFYHIYTLSFRIMHKRFERELFILRGKTREPRVPIRFNFTFWIISHKFGIEMTSNPILAN